MISELFKLKKSYNAHKSYVNLCAASLERKRRRRRRRIKKVAWQHYYHDYWLVG